MYCDNCGSQLPDGAGFCSNCGKKLSPQPINGGMGQPNNMNANQYQSFNGYPRQGVYMQSAVPLQPAPVRSNPLLPKATGFADGIRIFDIITSIGWIIIGALQIIAVCGGGDVFLLLIGIYNIINAIACLAWVKNITAGNSAVTDTFKTRIVTAVIALFVNLFIGAWLGCLLAIADFIVAVVVVGNSQYFAPNILG